MEPRIVYYNPSNEGAKTALVIESRKRLHVILIKHNGLVHRSLPMVEERYMRDLDMPIKKAVRSFGGVARRKGSTKAARTWLAKARECIA